LNGKPLAAEKASGRKFRRRMQIIFQDADGALDPRMKVQDLLLEPLRVHGLLNGKTKSAVARLMNMVNLAPELMNRYPHELSGGQRQRINIARAVCLDPEFLVADEPTASLDLLVQAQMLSLLKRIQSERRLGCLLISHDLHSIRRTADRVAVMYMGRTVEIGKTEDVFNQPSHPYTRALIDAALVGRLSDRRRGRRMVLKGDLLDSRRPARGCVFFGRCSQSRDVCSTDTPRERPVGPEHKVWCHQPDPGVSFLPNTIQATAP
jgi:oligopeptide/dipeptide ABC transporter ATP-binding protein